MGELKKLTTSAGVPIADNQNALTAGPRGPLMLQDYQLLEKLAHQMEDAFDLVVAGRMALTPPVCDALYDNLDVIQLVAGGDEADVDVAPLVGAEPLDGLGLERAQQMVGDLRRRGRQRDVLQRRGEEPGERRRGARREPESLLRGADPTEHAVGVGHLKRNQAARVG